MSYDHKIVPLTQQLSPPYKRKETLLQAKVKQKLKYST